MVFGVISTIGNIAPKQTATLVADFLSGNIQAAIQEQLRQKPLIDAIFSEVNPVPIKAAVSLLGKSDLHYRLPLGPPEKETINRLKKEMSAYGLL